MYTQKVSSVGQEKKSQGAECTLVHEHQRAAVQRTQNLKGERYILKAATRRIAIRMWRRRQRPAYSI